MGEELHNLMGKYEDRAKKIGVSTIDQLLSGIDLPYNPEMMAFHFSQHLGPQRQRCTTSSKDLVEHLETFKTHMTLHGFPGYINVPSTCGLHGLTTLLGVQTPPSVVDFRFCLVIQVDAPHSNPDKRMLEHLLHVSQSPFAPRVVESGSHLAT